jgi:hypothetical protein
MAIFYFNVITAGGTIFDEEGSDLSDLDTAKAEARRDAQSLISDAALRGIDISSRSIEVCNDQGRVLWTLPFTQALVRKD